MKRRKKELGLFCVLGMEKRHLAKIQLYETLMIAVISIGGGLLIGILFSKLILLLLFKLVHLDVPFGFHISPMAMILTALLFGAIFLLTLLTNLIRVGRAKPIELLRGGQVGQKEPKTKWLLAIVGVLALGAGYTIAIVVQSPLDAIFFFFVAVLLVILGTYCLFTAGSIVLLKLLRRRKGYYYRTKHFISVSGMIYRMKQNAVGLANICILSTMVLVTVSTTVALYAGMEDILTSRYPHDISVTLVGEEEGLLDETTLTADTQTVRQAAEIQGMPITYLAGYQKLSFTMNREGDDFTAAGDNFIQSKKPVLLFITAGQYEKLTGEKVELAEDEVLCYSSRKELGDSFRLLGQNYRVKEHLESFPIGKDYVSWVERHCFVVADDAVFQGIYAQEKEAYPGEYSSPGAQIDLDLEGTDEQILACYYKISEAVADATTETGTYIEEDGIESEYTYSTAFTECRQAAAADFYQLYGGFLFLGIFLGLLFLMATILIIYYKQITEGYDDKERFAIMQQVGMSRAEVKSAIRSQVLTVFFLPLIAAGIHIVFAFSIITKLLAVLNLTNIALFVWCSVGTIAVFALVYGIVYALTARAYYRIVS